jgi:hypothetical protein
MYEMNEMYVQTVIPRQRTISVQNKPTGVHWRRDDGLLWRNALSRKKGAKVNLYAPGWKNVRGRIRLSCQARH